MIEFITANVIGVLAMLIVIGSCIVPLLWDKLKK